MLTLPVKRICAFAVMHSHGASGRGQGRGRAAPGHRYYVFILSGVAIFIP